MHNYSVTHIQAPSAESLMTQIRIGFLEIIRDSINQIPLECSHTLKRGYATQIDILDTQYTATLAFSKIFLEIMCKEFLFEEDPSEEVLVDMAKELTNLTLGHTKVVAALKNIHFKISIPRFLGVTTIQPSQEILSFQLHNGYCIIFLHKQDKESE